MSPLNVCCAQGKELHGATEGILALKQAWPSAIRTVKGDHKRFEETYFATFPVSHPSVTFLFTSIQKLVGKVDFWGEIFQPKHFLPLKVVAYFA